MWDRASSAPKCLALSSFTTHVENRYTFSSDGSNVRLSYIENTFTSLLPLPPEQGCR